jgi:hypothetical protein
MPIAESARIRNEEEESDVRTPGPRPIEKTRKNDGWRSHHPENGKSAIHQCAENDPLGASGRAGIAALPPKVFRNLLIASMAQNVRST